jgi:molecular chaperone HtpG
VRVSERLTESAVCLVAPETGLDRQLERLLARAGQGGSAAKPILEVNPDHDVIGALANLPEEQQDLREDVAHLLLDEARILDGELPARSEGVLPATRRYYATVCSVAGLFGE